LRGIAPADRIVPHPFPKVNTQERVQVMPKKAQYFQSPEILEARIDEFFEDEDNEQPTIGSLILFCGVAKTAWYSYAGAEGFAEVIERARLRIETVVERRLLYGSNVTGPLFWLKNHAGYSDRRELTGAGGEPVTVKLDDSDAKLL